VRLITDANGRLLGRALLQPKTEDHRDIAVNGHITVGGFSADDLFSIGGILIGTTSRASRDEATPTLPLDILAKWATEQGRLHKAHLSENQLLHTSSVVRGLGGDLQDLPVFKVNDKIYSTKDFIAEASKHQKAYIVSTHSIESFRKADGFEFLHPLIACVSSGYQSILSGDHEWPTLSTEWKEDNSYYAKAIEGLIFELLAKAWGTPIYSIFKSDDNEDVACIAIKGVVIPISGSLIERPLPMSAKTELKA
jgi:hypothetical protein